MAKKLESNFSNMVLVLFIITLVTSAAVACIHQVTFGPIELAKEAKQTQAIQMVIPGEFNNDVNADKWEETTPDGGKLEFFPAKKDGELVGTAVKTSSNGFGGEFWIMVGFNPDGTVANYTVLEHKETPGLGSKMNVWFMKDGKGNIVGKNPAEQALAVRKDNGDIDAITAATITSRAFLRAVNRASEYLNKNNGVDSHSSATYKKEEVADTTANQPSSSEEEQ